MADGLDIKVFQYKLSEDYTRTKIYTQEEITNSVLQPLIVTTRTDTALDTSSLTILNKSDTPIKPFTRFKYEITTTIEDESVSSHVVDPDNFALYKKYLG